MLESLHFKHQELRCPCCGDNKMQKMTLERLEVLREQFGKALRLSSAYRCPRHNAAVSTTGTNGPHTTGQAVDILINGAEALRLLRLALGVGFSGIGISQKGPHEKRFVHLDDLQTNRPALWSY